MTPLHHCLFQLGQALNGRAWCESKLGISWGEGIEEGYIECALALLEAGSDLDARSKFKESCRDLLQGLPMLDRLVAALGVQKACSGPVIALKDIMEGSSMIECSA